MMKKHDSQRDLGHPQMPSGSPFGDHNGVGSLSPVQTQLSSKWKGLLRTISREDVPSLIS